MSGGVVLSQPGSSVPCDGCALCCTNDLLILHPEMGDDPARYQTMAVMNPITGEPALALKHKPEGGCVYLEPGVGCSIHGNAPAICREFDCRKFALLFTKEERKAGVAAGMFSKAILQAGFNRRHSLPAEAA